MISACDALPLLLYCVHFCRCVLGMFVRRVKSQKYRALGVQKCNTGACESKDSHYNSGILRTRWLLLPFSAQLYFLLFLAKMTTFAQFCTEQKLYLGDVVLSSSTSNVHHFCPLLMLDTSVNKNGPIKIDF